MQNSNVHRLFSTRMIRRFAYGFLAVALALYLVQIGYKWQLFYLRARELQRQLDRLWELLPDRHLLEPIMEDYKNGVEGLWRICPEPQQGICVTLMMASRWLKQGRVNAEQLAALRDTFALLRDETPSEADIRACHRKLIACGLPPMMTGSKELAELYEKDL